MGNLILQWQVSMDGGNLGLSTNWSGAIATFTAGSWYTYTTNLTLSGPAASNYTLNPSGTVTVVPTNLTVTVSLIYSQTKVVLSLVNNRNGTFTLNLRGTPGAQY